MRRIKRLHTFMLQTFLPLFLMTFGICLFIVLMQFIWRYIDDMVGKGLDLPVLGEMFLYAALFLIPMALPLAILLASLMTFGNLGERLELLAMKSAGVSLIRIMQPLTVLVAAISVGAFFFQNNAMPVIQVKLYSLLYSIRQKSPELDIPEGTFYNEITGYNVYVKHKDRETGLLRNIMIYDYANGFNNANIMVADSGRLKTSADKLFLILSLYNGESFANLKDQSDATGSMKAVPYRRESFKSRDILIEFDENFTRTDESFLQNQYIGKNLVNLQHSIDSMNVRLDSVRSFNAKDVVQMSYKKSFADRAYPGDKDKIVQARDKTMVINFDSLYEAKSKENKITLLARSKAAIENLKSDYFFRASSLDDEAYKVRRHKTEWHNKFTVSFACLIFFFIGAPLGAIIRKGGLGTPVVISVFLFIFYYVINNIGFKMARDGIWSAWEGMWLSSAVLAPLGIFLTYKAAHDSVILNSDTYLNAIKKLFGKKEGRKIERKEVIIYYPDYKDIRLRLTGLIKNCQGYISGHKRWIHYIRFWENGGRDYNAEMIAKEMESIVEELSNSDQNLVLNKLMDYPIISGYMKINARINNKTGITVGMFIPVGVPLYLLAVYQRKLLRHDIEMVKKASEDMAEIIDSEKLIT